jgi:hypothetical protein
MIRAKNGSDLNDCHQEQAADDGLGGKKQKPKLANDLRLRIPLPKA